MSTTIQAETIVDYQEDDTVVEVAASQQGVSYQLTVSGNPLGGTVAGTGDTIELPTGPLTDDTTFVVRATKLNHADIQVDLLQHATALVRPDPNKNVNVIVQNNGLTEFHIEASQLGVSYQLEIVPASSDQATHTECSSGVAGQQVGQPVVGTGGMIVLPVGLLENDTTLAIRASKISRPTINVLLNFRSTVQARPHMECNVTVSPQVVDYLGQVEVCIEGSQPGVRYQLTVGGNPVGAALDGNGGTLKIMSGPLTEDTTFIIRACKISNPSVCVDLQKQPTVRVRADSRLSVCGPQCPIDYGATAEISIEASQAGVSYQLTVNGSPVGTAVESSGGRLVLTTGPLTDDTTFRVRATRGGQMDTQVDLQAQILVIVKPNPGLDVSFGENP